jgi:flagellar biosynthetic protein FliR
MAAVPDTILSVFIVFCRIGMCLMLIPGYSSTNVPAQVRLFIAFSVALALTPLLLPVVKPLIANAAPMSVVGLIASELMVGGVIGLMGRVFFLALQTLATAMAMSIGLSTIPGTPIDDGEPLPALVPLITIAASALFFMTDQHWEVLHGLVGSYRIWQPSEGVGAQLALNQITDRLTDGFMLALRISSPFMIYGVVVNLAVGLANKLTPAIPVFFISMPFVLAGGLLLLYFTVFEMLHQFILGFSAWLTD